MSAAGERPSLLAKASRGTTPLSARTAAAAAAPSGGGGDDESDGRGVARKTTNGRQRLPDRKFSSAKRLEFS